MVETGAGQGRILGAMEESRATGVQRAKQRDSHRGSVLTSTHQPKRLLFTRWGRWGLGAEARASEVRSQGEDWGWRREHSLKGASAPQLAGRESGKKSGRA